MNKSINFYITKYYEEPFNIIINRYKLNKNIFQNEIIDINIYHNFDINILNKYDIIIKMKTNYSNEVKKLMLSYKTFINTFINYHLLQYKNILVNKINLYPYSYYLKKSNINEIEKVINIYNNKYNNDEIDKDFGKDYWIVKDNDNNRGINMNIYKTDELLKIKRDNIIIQKYLEKTYQIKNKKVDIRVHLIILPIIEYKDNNYQIKYKNNKIKLHYYLHNYILCKYSYNDFNLDDKNLKTHLTNQYIQGYDNTNNFLLKDQIILKKIKKKLKEFIKQKNIEEIIYNCIDNYPYFYQIIGIDLIISHTNHNIYIIDINTNVGLSYDTIYKSYLMILCLQRVIRIIYKLKYNKKYKINKNLISYLEKI